MVQINISTTAPAHYIFELTTHHRERVSGGSVGSGGEAGGVGCILGAQVQSGRRWGGDSPLQCLNLTVGWGEGDESRLSANAT